MERPSKICAACGRSFEWRKKWERDWANVKYCSDRCRRQGGGTRQIDQQLEATILDLLHQRDRSATICPSEAARTLRKDDWRELMEPARQAARRLVDRGVVTIMQNGREVNPSAVRGPIRIKLR